MIDYSHTERGIRLPSHEKSNEIIRYVFNVTKDRWGMYPYWDIHNVAKSFEYIFLIMAGMESYPRALYAKKIGDALILVDGGQLDDQVRVAVGNRGHKNLGEPVKSDYGGRMFNASGCKKDNENVKYIGGRIITCPLSGKVKFHYSKYDPDIYLRHGSHTLGVVKITEDQWREIKSDQTNSRYIYRKLSPASSRKEVVLSYKKEDVKIGPWAYAYHLLKDEKKENVSDLVKFMSQCGQKVTKTKNAVYVKDLRRAVSRRIRRKRITKSEQNFFASIIGASKMAKLLAR